MTWWGSYIDKKTASHVKTIVSGMPRIIKDIKVSGEIGEDGVPGLAVRDGGKVENARYQLDRALLGFDRKQKKRSNDLRGQCIKTRDESTSFSPR